jgi:cell wall arabinan synthesis protein
MSTRLSAVRRRTWAALALALISLVAAAVGALGPADAVRTTYSWPPANVPTGEAARLSYAPLLLNRQEPESLSVRIPCSLAAPVPGADEPTTIVATGRDASVSGGLAVTRAGDLLTIEVAGRTLGQVEIPAAGTSDDRCAYDLRLADGRFSVRGGRAGLALDGALERMPAVFGLFSGLDLRSGGAPTVDVTTVVHDTQATLRQTIAWIVAVATILGALLLAGGPVRLRPAWACVRDGTARAIRHAGLADAVVAITLVCWWIVAPVIWDDGWVVARERTLQTSGGLSTYYNAFGVNLPLDYWVEWLHHLVAERTSVVLNLRLHALVALAVIWVLLRWALGQVRGPLTRRWDASVWALASAFLVGALAWDMAIRPEPVTALLATGVAACAIRFATRGTTAALAMGGLLIPLALTAHHTGVVALAPALAVAPRLVSWARSRLATAGALVIASVSWTIVLAFVGSDVGQRLADARTTSEFGITSSWRDELSRYVNLNTFPWATPLRRASVALIGLALLAFVTRCRTGRRLLDLPATTLGLALVLFVITPSKIPWHFGALTGLLALAVGAEVSRIRDDGARSRGWQVRPYLIVGAGIVAAAWSWFPRDAWNPLDLRSLAWVPGVDAVLPFSKLAIALPAIVLGCAMLVGARRGTRFAGAVVPWRVAGWVVPMLAGPLIVFTIAVLARDFQRTDGWTLTRQNLESIVGRSGCGLADDATAALWSSSRSLPAVDGDSPAEPGSSVPPSPVSDLPRSELSTSAPETPWYRLPADRRLGLFVAGSSVTGGEVALQWGRDQGGQIDVLRTDAVGAIEPRVETSPWTFVAASELPPPHPLAEVVRVALPASAAPSAPVAVTAPVTYRTETLSRLISDPDARTLVHPALLLYVPCARQPKLADGVVEVPRYFVWFDHPYQPHPFEPTSPFLGVHDLYPVQRLPLTDGTNPPAGVVVYEVDPRLPDAERLAADVDVDGS